MDNAEDSLRLADVWAFCHARLNETATALLTYRDGHQGPCINYPGQPPTAYDDHDSCALHLAVAEATPYRDVEFGLTDIAFKRNMLEEHEPHFPAAAVAVCRTDGDTCPFTQQLATLYADHPDYQESWRP